MTDELPPDDDALPDDPVHDDPAHDDPVRDERVSAVLDGEATPDEVAAVTTDPSTARQLDRLRHLRDGLRDLALDTDERRADARVERAMAALDSSLPDPEPHPLAPARLHARPAGARRRMRLVGTAAAAVVLVLVGLGLLRTTGDSDSTLASGRDETEQSSGGLAAEPGPETTTIAGDRSADALEGAPASTAPEEGALATPAAGSANAAPTGFGPWGWRFGELDDVAALRAALQAAGRPPTLDPTLLPCPTPIGRLVNVGEATVGGRALVAFETIPASSSSPEQPGRVAVVDATTCEVLG